MLLTAAGPDSVERSPSNGLLSLLQGDVASVAEGTAEGLNNQQLTAEGASLGRLGCHRLDPRPSLRVPGL
jgi:hypothetical protein